jgi:hydrogenase nickel incorporation protein HypB
MCTTCGCGQGETRIEGEGGEHVHVLPDGTVVRHAHEHVPGDAHGHPPDAVMGEAAARAHAASLHGRQGASAAGHAAHSHAHRHADGTVHAHAHVHEGEHAHDHHAAGAGHVHEHVHADGTVHRHWHSHEGEHDHAHAQDEWHGHEHVHADGTVHRHDHEHDGEHAHAHPGDQAHARPAEQAHEHLGGAARERLGEQAHDHAGEDAERLHFGTGPAGAHAPGMSQARMLRIEQDILAKNDGYAAANREWLADRGIFAVNLVSSPGSGKTSILVRTIEALREAVEIAVIEGDQQTTHDADRIRATGTRALQVNTGKGCHLDAHMVGRALDRLAPAENSVLMIENVGNLVCPSAFDLGEAHKVVVLSVTEGEDKPLKYPDMFHAASLMLLNKIDLLPYLDFAVERCLEYARRVNPQMAILPVSARTGQGLEQWFGWILEGARRAQSERATTVDALRRRIADLEAELAHLRSQ